MPNQWIAAVLCTVGLGMVLMTMQRHQGPMDSPVIARQVSAWSEASPPLGDANPADNAVRGTAQERFEAAEFLAPDEHRAQVPANHSTVGREGRVEEPLDLDVTPPVEVTEINTSVVEDQPDVPMDTAPDAGDGSLLDDSAASSTTANESQPERQDGNGDDPRDGAVETSTEASESVGP